MLVSVYAWACSPPGIVLRRIIPYLGHLPRKPLRDRYSQAHIYHQLGIVAQEQRQWAQAEDYYRQALELFVEFNDRYAQALTYHQLGMVAQEQRQWAQAEEHFLRALETYVDYEDEHNLGIVLGSLARLHRAGGGQGLAEAVAKVLGISSNDAEALLARAAGG